MFLVVTAALLAVASAHNWVRVEFESISFVLLLIGAIVHFGASRSTPRRVVM
jgi:hypothetical protein